jgi:hypothetical protein
VAKLATVTDWARDEFAYKADLAAGLGCERAGDRVPVS